MDNRVADSVGARLKTSITDVGLAIKIELLGKTVAGFVGGVCDGEWECSRSAARGDEEEERILRQVDNVCVVLVSVIEECMSCKSCKRQFGNEVGMRPEGLSL